MRQAAKVKAKAKAVIAAALLLAVVRPADAALTARAAVERSPVFAGEVFTLTIEIEGTQNAEAPEFAAVDGVQIRYVGPTNRFSSVNGRVTTSVTHAYALTAQRVGRIALGPFTVRAGNEVITAEAVEVVVSPRTSAGGAAAAGEPVQLLLAPEKTTAFVGERVAVRLELRVGDIAVDNLRFPALEAEGFAAEPLTQPSRSQEIVSGKRWTVLGFRTVLTPLRPGSLTLGPARMQLDVIESARGRGSLFDEFFSGGRRRTHELQSSAATMQVQALPAEGRPADFSGAVGQFELDVEATPTTLAAGDPVTVRMRVRGVGNLDNARAPQVPAGDEFRSYEPTVVQDEAGPGRLEVEQVLIPRDENVRRIPSVRFTFFEPESASYRVLERGPFALEVRPSQVARGPEVLGGAPAVPAAPPAEKLGRDIVYIKERPGQLRRHADSFHLKPWFAALQLMPPLLGFGAIRLVRRRRAIEADPRSQRYRRAGRIARREMTALAATLDDPRFYDELTASTGRYLAAKLDLPPGALERSAVLAHLKQAGNDTQTLAELVSRYFDLIERVRYASAAGSAGDRSRALELANALVDALERERGLAPARMALALLAPLLLSIATAFAAGDEGRDPHTMFHDGNAAYRRGDYQGAAQEYQRLLAAGFESDALLFNLGNAEFKQGRNGRAILAYERARRLAPRDPDIKTNLTLAREVAKSPEEAPPAWQRVVFAPAWSLSTGHLALVWTVLWCAAWALIAAVALGRSLRGSAAAVAVLTLFLGASLARRVWLEEFSPRAVVVAAASARFEPAEGGKEHFQLREGATVDIGDTREGWAQVRRGDGLRGWVPAALVERLRL